MVPTAALAEHAEGIGHDYCTFEDRNKATVSVSITPGDPTPGTEMTCSLDGPS